MQGYKKKKSKTIEELMEELKKENKWILAELVEDVIYAVGNDKRAYIALIKLIENDIWVKIYSEKWNPKYHDCPEELLEELVRIENTTSINWRKKCWDNIKNKKRERGELVEEEIKTEEHKNEKKGEDETDLYLKDLGFYTGTEEWHNFGPLYSGIIFTDGLKYIADNGYFYLVSDIAIVIKHKFLRKDFLVIEFKKNKKGNYAFFISEDTVEKESDILYTQEYAWCDAKVESLKFYFENKVLLLPSER